MQCIDVYVCIVYMFVRGVCAYVYVGYVCGCIFLCLCELYVWYVSLWGLSWGCKCFYVVCVCTCMCMSLQGVCVVCEFMEGVWGCVYVRGVYVCGSCVQMCAYIMCVSLWGVCLGICVCLCGLCVLCMCV